MEKRKIFPGNGHIKITGLGIIVYMKKTKRNAAAHVNNLKEEEHCYWRMNID